jgi:hypothetical protein
LPYIPAPDAIVVRAIGSVHPQRREQRMRRFTVLALVAMVAVALTSFGFAEEKKAAETHHKVVGEVVSVDAMARTITLKETVKGGTAKEVTLKIAENAKIMIHGKTGTIEELKVGDSVTAKYEVRSGSEVAEELNVAKPPAPKSGK